MGQEPHNKILNATAREVLKPMGLVQKGRSRTWLDDHGWWLCVVDFESSAWSKGTRLAVSADFLWHDRDHLAWSVGGRLKEDSGAEIHVYYENEPQFSAEAQRLSVRAADE